MFESSIVVAIITGLCVAVPSITATFVSANTHDQIIDERMTEMNSKISDLTKRVDTHNHYSERLAVIERDLKTAFKLIDDMKG